MERKISGGRPRSSGRECAASGALLLAAAAVLLLAARYIPGFADWYAHAPYSLLVGIFGRISGIFPFSVVEICLYMLVLWLLYRLLWKWRELKETACRLLLLAGILAFTYTVGCGINYQAAAFSAYAGLTPGQYTKEELVALCESLVERINAELAASGSAALESYTENRAEFKEEAVTAMRALGGRFGCLSGFYPAPKELLVSRILSVQQLCGVYSPFTIEANFNGEMPDYNIPHTLCHELSHLRGFMREDEANFIGYLACVTSENAAFRYSGLLTGWVYAGNACGEADWEAYLALSGQLCEQAREDLAANSRFWEQFEGKIAETAKQANDIYLKANSQEDGVKSYGRMVDLMLVWEKLQDR